MHGGGAMERSQHTTRWVTFSILLHVAFFAILALTPAGKVLFDRSEAGESAPAVHADKIEHVVDHLRRREQEKLSDQVEEMYYVERQMDEILDEKIEQYEMLSDDLADEAPQKALEELEKAIAAQQEAAAKQSEAMEIQEQAVRQADAEYEQARPDPNREQQSAIEQSRKDVLAEQTEVKEVQAKAADAQKQAGRHLYFASEEFKAAKESQRRASAAQEKANEVQDKAQSLQSESYDVSRDTLAKALKELRDARRNLERDREDARKRRSRMERAENSVENAERELEEARADEKKWQKALEQAEGQVERVTAAETDDGQVDAKDLKDAENQVRNAEKRLKDAERKLESRTQNLKRNEEKLAEEQENLREAEAEIEPAQQRSGRAEEAARQAVARAEELQAQAERAQRQAREYQKQAVAAQKEAIAAIKQVLENTANTEDMDSEALSDFEEPDAMDYSQMQEQLSSLNVADLYEQALESESRIADKHKQIKGASTALEGVIPMGEAMSQTVVAKTNRPALDRPLLTQSVRTAGGAAQHKAEMTRVRQEIGSMVAGAYQRLSEAQGMGQANDTTGDMGVSLADIKAAAEMAASMKAGALEDAGERYKDLAALMAQADTMGMGYGTGMLGKGEGVSPGAGGFGEGLGPGEGGGMPARSAGFGGNGAGGSGGFSSPFQGPSRSPNMRILGGTRVMVNGMQGVDTDQWMCVDTWYTIGPFPNPNRRNIDTKFPPESVIDLDAVYTGKDNRRIRWKFVKSPGVMVVPADDDEYCITYAYTELWYDEACDLLIAVGSDDNSRLWINGHLVWMSRRQLKGWQVDEGFRKVHFRKGVNKVLYRIENGWRSMAFSMLIEMRER